MLAPMTQRLAFHRDLHDMKALVNGGSPEYRAAGSEMSGRMAASGRPETAGLSA